jgi:hypothetical protein
VRKDGWTAYTTNGRHKPGPPTHNDRKDLVVSRDRDDGPIALS